jgi:hypothetical protein
MDRMCETCPRRRPLRRRLRDAMRVTADAVYDGLIVVGYSSGAMAPVPLPRRSQWRRGSRTTAPVTPPDCPCHD